MIRDEHAAEQWRRRRTARHLGLSVVAVMLFALAVAVLYLRSGPVPKDQGPGPSPSPAPQAAGPTTLLIQVTGSGGAVGNMLTAAGPNRPAPGSMTLLLPDSLVVASREYPPRPLRDTVGGLDTLRPVRMVAETLGVRVDASWRLDRKALAGLVDAVGGAEVEPERRLVLRDEDGTAMLRLQRGVQELSGTAASWYAVGRVRGEDPVAAARRFGAVAWAALAGLPSDEAQVRETLTALGALSPSTISTEALSRYLVALAGSLRPARPQARPQSLPVTVVGTGPDSLAWTDYDRATPLLRQGMTGALWVAGRDGPARVLVQAAGGPAGLVLSTRRAVQSDGYVWVDGRGTPARWRNASTILVRGPRQWGLDIASALRLPATAVVPARIPGPVVSGTPWADIDVVLGRDYRPG